MADNIIGNHIQGCLDEGQPAANERPVLVAGKDQNGNIKDIPIDAAGVQVDIGAGPFPISGTVTANQGAAGSSEWIVRVPDETITGTLSNNGDLVTLPLSDAGSAVITITGSWTGTLKFEASADGSNYIQALAFNSSGASCLFTTTSNKTVFIPVAGYASIRVRSIAAMTGTATVTIRSSSAACDIRALTVLSNFLSLTDGRTNGIQVLFDNYQNLELSNISYNYGYAGVVGGVAIWDRVRVTKIFKTASANAAGSTALWTPTSGRKFRLMRYRIDITDDATLAGAGRLTVTLLDAAVNIAQNLVSFVPSIALDTSGLLATTGWIDLGNGVLSAAANNVLNINLSAALTAGIVNVVCCGTEE